MVEAPIVLDELRTDPGRVLASSESASLIDLDDGVLCLEFHSKGNTLDVGTLEVAERANALIPGRYKGLVIGNQGTHFSFGANLRFLLGLLERFDTDRSAFRAVGKRFQRLTTGMRTAPFPTVAAPFGLTVGGALELSMYADRVQACADLRASLPELAVGIIPDLGGTSELYVRCVDASGDPAQGLRTAFEIIALGKASENARAARGMNFLKPHDAITTDRARLLNDAKAKTIELANGYIAPEHRIGIAVLGDSGYAALDAQIAAAQNGGIVTEHDAQVARALACVMTGGPGPARTVSHQELLDLETDYFETLVWNPKTRARMQHMLERGEPLRN
ncbi:MAG: enoyl-CoA hydratase/isomerase family protein [Vulcanimicrobiaceae bacterium]